MKLTTVISGKKQDLLLIFDEAQSVTSIFLDGREVTFHGKNSVPESGELTPGEISVYMPFFSKSRECWFEGCEEMRSKYFEEVEELDIKYKGKCPSCKKGGVIRKYIQELKDANVPPP